MHFLIVIYTACNSLANWWWLFLGSPSSHFDLEGWQKYPPAGFCGGRSNSHCYYKYLLKKSHICEFLMDWAILYKISALDPASDMMAPRYLKLVTV